jgi:hypothetical protein
LNLFHKGFARGFERAKSRDMQRKILSKALYHFDYHYLEDSRLFHPNQRNTPSMYERRVCYATDEIDLHKKFEF